MSKVKAPALQDKFLTLEETLNTEIIEREIEIRACVNALVAGHHVFFLGAPGTAKSYLFTRVLKHIADANKFSIMLTRYTVPEETNGPQSVQAMKNDEYIRKIDGYLPSADIAFVDEIFKANSAILNSLLQMVNERLYRHGTNLIGIPLSTLFCASNELPQEDNLRALYDRLLVRLEVREIQDPESLGRMLTLSVDPNPTPILTWDEVLRAKEQATQVGLSGEVIDGLIAIQRDLRSQNIHVTDRRLRHATDIVRASAWLDGEKTADLEHLRPLRHVFWERPDQIHTVEAVVSRIASPLDAEALTLLDEITGLRHTCERLLEEQAAGRLSEQEVKRSVMTEFRQSERFMEVFEDLERRANSRRRPSDPMLKCIAQFTWLTRFFKEAFKLDNASGMKTLERFDD